MGILEGWCIGRFARAVLQGKYLKGNFKGELILQGGGQVGARIREIETLVATRAASHCAKPVNPARLDSASAAAVRVKGTCERMYS